MADSTIDTSLIVLKDNFWPGSPLQMASIPTDGWTGANHHNVAVAAFPVGTKIQAYHKNTGGLGVPGLYTMIYLQFGTKLAASTLAAKHLCVPQDATMTYKVTNAANGANVTLEGGGVLALSTMTDSYYGWFLCDGVCPTDAVAALDGNTYTVNSVAAKSPFFAAVAAGTTLTANAAVLAITAAATNLGGGFGYALAADA